MQRNHREMFGAEAVADGSSEEPLTLDWWMTDGILVEFVKERPFMPRKWLTFQDHSLGKIELKLFHPQLWLCAQVYTAGVCEHVQEAIIFSSIIMSFVR